MKKEKIDDIVKELALILSDFENHEDVITVLEELIISGEEKVVIGSLRMIEAADVFTPKIYTACIELSRSDNNEIKTSSINILGNQCPLDRNIEEVLISSLNAEDIIVRRMAASHLGKQSSRAVRPLVEAMKVNNDENIKYLIIESLGELQHMCSNNEATAILQEMWNKAEVNDKAKPYILRALNKKIMS